MKENNKLHAVRLISKHLKIEGLQFSSIDIDSICAFTGDKITKGYSLKSILSGNFSDIEFIKFNSEYMSENMAMCLKPCLEVDGKLTELRKYSFLATEKELITLRADNLMQWFLAEKETPFVFCVGSLRASKAQKHTSFKAKLNYSNDEFVVSTEIGNVTVNIAQVKYILPIIQNWYSVTESTKNKSTQLTYFNKEELLFGCNSIYKIEQYGAEKYFVENAKLDKYRGALWYELIIKSIQKTV